MSFLSTSALSLLPHCKHNKMLPCWNNQVSYVILHLRGGETHWKSVQIPGPISPSLNTALLTLYCTQPMTTKRWVDLTDHLDVFVYECWKKSPLNSGFWTVSSIYSKMFNFKFVQGSWSPISPIGPCAKSVNQVHDSSQWALMDLSGWFKLTAHSWKNGNVIP